MELLCSEDFKRHLADVDDIVHPATFLVFEIARMGG